ncbi:HAD family hydrolase [Neoactinobaculum massilliense]|uniref:HAD family hydrolase n=1 Tax=Neoactinobaculum massilliense TaxID=2364794 RepID=UPI000F524DF2|nr:HAD family hydrolase [Neoactinobaculum massilliense]
MRPNPTDLNSLAQRAADIQLVVADLDGTLLLPDKTLPAGFAALMERMAAAGVRFVPGSGRQLQTLEDMFGPWGASMPIIAENGANVGIDGTSIATTFLPARVAYRAVSILRTLNTRAAPVGIIYCGEDAAYAELNNPEFVKESLAYYHANRVVDDLLALPGGAFKIAAYDFADPATHILPALEELRGLADVTQSGQHWVDINPRDASKGRAIAVVQEHFGITPAQTVAFGDFHNDISMFSRADLSFAMANAHPDVLAAARYIAPMNSEAGVVRTVNGLLDLAGR